MVKAERKGILTLLIIASVVLSLLFLSAIVQRNTTYAVEYGQWSEFASTELLLLDSENPNSITNPYLISSAEDLALLSNNVNTDEKYINTYFLQTADLDLTGNIFTPIGFGSGKEFCGIYDGGNFEIQNIIIDKTSQNGVGLFGNVRTTASTSDEAGTIKNIHITSGYIIGKDKVGGIVGDFNGKKISNCFVDIEITNLDDSAQNIGGIAGYSYGTIENCAFYGLLDVANAQDVGGIVGTNGTVLSQRFAKVYDCFNTGSILGSSYVGGIAGRNYGEISNVYNTGDVTANSRAAGLVGYEDGSLSSGYSIGELTFGSNFVGAIIGERRLGSDTERLYYNKNTSNIASLEQFAIGKDSSPISSAKDDEDEDIRGLDFYEMINLAEKMVLDEGKWSTIQSTENTGYVPYLSFFDNAESKHAPLAIFGGEVSSPLWGTYGVPYLISVPNQFNLIATNVNENGFSYESKDIELAGDINFSNLTDFEPIGIESNPFSAKFDGKGYELKNLTIASNNDYIALFAYSTAYIYDITINNFAISGEDYVSTLVASQASGDIAKIRLINCTVTGSGIVGGVVANSQDCAISECMINLTTLSGDKVGGVVGIALEGTMRQNYVDASITSTGTAGGIIAECFGFSTVLWSYFIGNLIGGSEVGGIVGRIDGGTISYSFAFVDEIVGEDYVGGLAGIATSALIRCSYAIIANIKGRNEVAGLVANLDEDSDIMQSYFSGDIEFEQNGYSISNYSPNITNVFYNSDTLTNEQTILNGEAKTSVQLSNNFTLSGFLSMANEGFFGYLPQLSFFDDAAPIISKQSTKIYYFQAGAGTEGNPYKISEKEHLINMQGLVDTCYDSYKDKFFALTNDITLVKDFEPIASFTNPFLGDFNGNYYSIYNLTINKADSDYVGLFSCIGVGAYIRKLNIRPVVISSTETYGSITGQNYVGAFAGYSSGYIWDCMNNTDVSGTEYVGGIAGRATGISRSFNTAAIVGDSIVGGIAGLAEGSIQQAFNSGYIKVNVEIGGGIAGKSTSLIEICYNSGNIESELVAGMYTGTIKGGLIGQNEATVRNSYSIANLKGAAGFIVGGIIGINTSAEVSRSYYNKEVAAGIFPIGDGSIGGADIAGLTTIQMVGSNALSNMTFASGNYVANENRGMDADFAPQLAIFSNLTVGINENTAIISIIKGYSKQSVMLRLFGRDVYNLMDWGGEHNPYLIATYDHLDTLSKQVAEGYGFANSYFLVVNDINMLVGFLPIGSYHNNAPNESTIFLGQFDGGGFTLTNLVVGTLSSENSQGLFGYVGASGIVKNVIIGSGSIKGSQKVGSIAGYSLGIITRCYSSASVEGTTYIGGIVGQQQAQQVSHSLFDGSVLGNSYWGGITGLLGTTTASVVNCWYVLNIETQYTHNNIGSLLYIDKNGSVNADVDFNASDIKDFIYFEFLPDSGFGFDIRNISNSPVVVFNAGGLVENKYFPMYNNDAYIGTLLHWYARFTKVVSIGEIANGTAYGGGKFYEGQSVSIMVNPDIGYKVLLTSEYTYAGDGETIICTRIMGHDNWEFTVSIVAFGNGATEIINPRGEKATIDADSFEYDATPKVYTTNIEGYTTIEEYYGGGALGIRIESAIMADSYLLVIKLQLGNVIVGLKHINFVIVPLKLTLDIDKIESENYVVKQYDKYSYNEMSIAPEAISGVVGGDEIFLSAVRRYYNDAAEQDPNIGENKLVTFHMFTLSGSGAMNYTVPDDVVGIDGSIIKRDAFIRILSDILTKQYDASPPLITAHSFEGDLGDGLFVNEFSFTRTDDMPTTGWEVGTYIIGLTENISGSKENYDIQFIQEYQFEITPKIIDDIIFAGYQNLAYTGSSLNTEITAKYAKTTNTFAPAYLTFYNNNLPIAECINAGSYIAKASIPDGNFLLDSEKSINFVISKINQPTPLILEDIADNTYALTQAPLFLSGGDGDGSITYQVLQGAATIKQGILFINGTGDFVIRATKGESENYFTQLSNTVSFVITKGTLTPIVNDVYISYGETPAIEIEYSGYLRNEQGKEEVLGLVEPSVIILGDDLVVNEEGYEIYLRDNSRADGYIIDISALTARLYVQKKQIHIQANAVSKIYGLEDPSLSFTILEDNSLTLNGEPKRVLGENAGRYLIEQNSLTSENNPNYNIIYVPSYFTIYPKELRISIPTYTKTYGTPDPEIEFLIQEEDLKMGDNFTILTGTIARDEGENVGQYAFRYSNVRAGINYTVRFTEVRGLQIQKATPTFITAPSARGIVYGDTLSKSVITGEASIYGAFLWIDTSIMPSVFNSQSTLYSGIFVPTDSSNYNNVEFKVKLNVQPRNISVAFVGNTNLVYDGNDKANFTAIAYNVLEGDDLKVNIEYSKEFLVDAGSYFAQASIDDINYSITENKIIYITIGKSQLNIGIKNATIVEGEEYEPEIIYSGFKGADTEDVLTTKARVLNVPTAPGKYNLILDGAEADNYMIYYTAGKLIINRKSFVSSDVKVEGNMPYDASIYMQEKDKESDTFVMLEDFVSSNLASSSQKGKKLGSFYDIFYDNSLTEEMTFSFLIPLDEGTPLIIKHKDGSIEILTLTDYEYSDGFVIISTSNLSGIGVLRDATFYEKYGIYTFFAGLAIIATFAGFIISIFVKKAKIKKKRLTPRFKD